MPGALPELRQTKMCPDSANVPMSSCSEGMTQAVANEKPWQTELKCRAFGLPN